ncbi:hypothetical protein VT84_07360 [Gemmata sp. SH-PL17]|uniref:hypothetical protein n=1 Tax=Gemmata sp. SH-PL17 TaxID=1630693 RepID=UPI00078B63A9|nr:hypothetical protein [Gemmata sp. SH-PL17]AMV24198.1 hypothetical protein VT84_07360 [Gemmata sp. SH-PL17]
MLTAFILIAGLSGAGDKEFRPFVSGDMAPDPAPAAAFDKVRDGLTLKEAVALLGPGYVPKTSGTGHLRWTCTDGRELTASHVTNPNAVLRTTGKGTKDEPWLKMRGKDGKELALPGRGDPLYTDEEAAVFAERLAALYEAGAGGKRKVPESWEGMVAALKLDADKLGKSSLSVGNATDWVHIQLSPKYTLVATYDQFKPKAGALRHLEITRDKPVKPK